MFWKRRVELQAGERIACETTLHPVTALLWFIPILGQVIVARGLREEPVAIKATLIGSALFLALLLWQYADAVRSSLTLTTRRIIYDPKRGRETGFDFEIWQIVDIDFVQGFPGMLLNYGTLVVTHPGGIEVGIAFVRNPRTFVERFRAVRKAAEKAREARTF